MNSFVDRRKKIRDDSKQIDPKNNKKTVHKYLHL